MEITPFLWTFLWNLIVAVWIIFTILLASRIKKSLSNYLELITATTVWLLLWIIFLWFIPNLNHAFEDKGIIMWVFILIWIFFFYILELFLHWHHCKDLSHEKWCSHSHAHSHKSWALMFAWTLMHNALHGVVLFSAFAVSFNFWIATTLAVLLHSIPQNIVNYVMNEKRVKFAYIAAFGWIFWALITFPFALFLTENKFYFLSVITWGLLYTALTDIFPEFKNKWSILDKVKYLLFVILWIFIFVWFSFIWEHEHVENSDEYNKKIHLEE